MHLFPRRGERRELEKHVQCSALQPAKPDTAVIVVWDKCLSPQPELSHPCVLCLPGDPSAVSCLTPGSAVCVLDSVTVLWWNTALIQADSSGHRSSAAHFTHFPFMLQQRESKLYISVFKNRAGNLEHNFIRDFLLEERWLKELLPSPLHFCTP